MALDRTQHQSTDEMRRALELSLEPTRPPTQVPGYKLQRFLGSGAFGQVWSGSNLKTGRRVAIKFYTGRSASDVKLLSSEVEKLVALAADRYVVQLLDVGWDADPPYYVMDFIEHGSLEERLKESSTLPVSEAVELFQELVNGMMHLHDRGILHCDLKPGNVLLDQDGKPRVADFGQSRLSSDETAALGTLFYMAPEQASLDAAPDARWDVYGLGALLYSMLTGQPPYYSADLAARVDSKQEIGARLETYRHGLLNAPKPTDHRLLSGVDRALAEIIDRCIAVDPHRRFSNVQSVMLALRQRELAKARRPLMILGLLGPLLLVGVMSSFGWFAFRKAVDRTQTEITSTSVESNKYAAKLAARSAAEQIDEYFRVVYQLTQDEGSFLPAFDRVIDDPALLESRRSLADPHTNSRDNVEPIEAIGLLRAEFRDNDLRKTLQPFLEERLFNATRDYPPAASWFVCDRYGNQIASAFRKDNKTLGNNYAYRTYFTGLPTDLKTDLDGRVQYDVSEAIEDRQIIDRPHLSASFISEQSNKWKIAFSAPIVRRGKVAGIVAVTVDLGNLIEFENFNTHYAMMVDTREGDNRGVVLEHPLFPVVLTDYGTIPDELIRCRVELDNLVNSKHLFLDPVGATHLGQAASYDRPSIVAKAPVTMEIRRPHGSQAGEGSSDPGTSPPQRRNTGLVVFAVEEHASIVAPAIDLSRQLGRMALIAAFVLFGLTTGMWLFVKRMLQESRQRLERAFSPTIDSTAIQDVETIADAVESQTTNVHPADQ